MYCCFEFEKGTLNSIKSLTENQKTFITGWESIEHDEDTDISDINEAIYSLIVSSSITKTEILGILDILKQKSENLTDHSDWVVQPSEMYDELTTEMLFHEDSDFYLESLEDEDLLKNCIT